MENKTNKLSNFINRYIKRHNYQAIKDIKKTSKDIVISVQRFDFSYNFGKKQALFDINLDIIKNKITAFIGPSGCGKSTLLRAINRMNDLIEGTSAKGAIVYNNFNIYDPKQDIIELRTKIGMVFQKPNPFPKSIYENVAFGPRNLGIRDRRILDEIVIDSLKKAALWEEVKDDLKASALSLSGGQQQRLCIARAIAMKPDVLLMDEPTSALDPIATAKIEQLILQLKKNFTIIIVTHSMQQAARISDYTAFFLMGKLIESNFTKAIFSKPKNRNTEEYITGRFG